MTKYKLLKTIKNVEWNVGEVREMEGSYGTDYIKYKHVGYTTCMNMYPPEIALLEHAGFIEDVNEVQPETPKRWRAERGEEHYYLDTDLEVEDRHDNYCQFDYNLYKAGNYFQNIEQAVEFQKGVKALVGIK